MLEAFGRIAYRIFGRIAGRMAPQLESVRLDIKKGQLDMLLEEYLSIALMFGLFSFVLGGVAGFFLSQRMLPQAPDMMLLVLNLFVGLIFSTVTFLAFMSYPSMAASGVKRGIEINMPFAVMYMSTVSGSGIPPHIIFKLLSRFKEYGEISKECGNITAETEFFGKDISEAIRRAAGRTPSEDFKELLWGMDTIIAEGGNLRKFLSNSAMRYMNKYKRRIQAYSHQLSLFLEIYLTVVVVGSIFFMIMGAIMASMGGMPPYMLLLQRLVVYLALPLVTIAFIFLIRITSPMA